VIGYSSDEIIEGGIKNFFQLVIPDDYLNVKKFFNQNILMPEGVNYHNFLDFRIKNKNDHLTWLECKFFKNVKFFDEKQHLFGILKDITKHKKSEQFLWENLEKNVTSLKELKKIRRNYKYFFRSNGHTNKIPTSYNFDKVSLKVNGNNQHVTKREKEVLQLLANGYSTKQIASKLNISYHTVVSHRKNIISKFQVQNTAELISKAMNSFWL